MKKFWWLLALPYFVRPNGGSEYRILHNDNVVKVCGDKEECDDIAFALNEAHKKRHEWGDENKDPKELNWLGNKSACGADDCGKDAK